MPKALWNEPCWPTRRMRACSRWKATCTFPWTRCARTSCVRVRRKRSAPGRAQPAIYYDVVVDGQVNRDAAWYYPTPKDAVKHIAGHVAFWHGVRVEG